MKASFLSFSLKIFGILLFLVGCIQIEPNKDVQMSDGNGQALTESTQTPIHREVRDVDMRARGENKMPRKRILVLPFLDQDAVRPVQVRDNARTAFINELNKSDEILAVEPTILKEDISKYIKNSEYDLLAISKQASKNGVGAILEGKIVDVRFKRSADQIGYVRNLKTAFEVVINMRIVNTRSEQEVFNMQKIVTVEQDNTRIAQKVKYDRFFSENPELVEILIKDAFLDFVPQIDKAMVDVTWEGRIAAIHGDKIYLNVGRISGVQIGDILKVVEDGSEVYDPEIGYHIGKVPGKVKGTLEVVSYFGYDGAVATLHSGAGFKEDDRVELYK